MADRLHKKNALGNSLRIIGGQWRGRRISFLDAPGLRPTPDRIRETLFNWLQYHVAGAHCLDLFAGSGALGLEALSRGARSAVLVEANHGVASHLATQIGRLATANARLLHQDAREFLDGAATPFDIVFVDPPFQLDLWSDIAARLQQGGWLSAAALIYVESPVRQGSAPIFPSEWQILKDKTAGEVRYRLFRNASD
jgi:16S rRNA (guanine966-N2)-methyltransferase